jgi:dephospho-CoA kinase
VSLSPVLTVGLTGGIACGKSRVRRRLAGAGFATLDLDAVAHAVIAPGGAAHEDTIAAFGPGILAADGTIDRKALGARVFADAAARARLNALVHPRVREEEARRAAAHEAAGGRVFVTDAALLVEAGLHLRFDRLVVVDCPPDEQLRRLMARDGLEEEAARRRIEAQMPGEEKRRFAHVVLDASGTLEATDSETDRVAAELTATADHPPPRPRVREEAVLAALAAGPARGPRGLDPVRWARDVAAGGGAEMERLKGLLVPPFEGPWYEAAAETADSEPGPEALALVVGAWSAARRGLDPAFTAAAMFSMARLTHRDAARTAAACMLAVAAAHVAGGVIPGPADLRAWAGAARHSIGAPAWTAAVVAAALSRADGEPAVPAAAQAAGVDPSLVRGLAALASARPPSGVPPALVEVAHTLAGSADPR